MPEQRRRESGPAPDCVQSLLREAGAALATVSTSPRLDAELLLAHALDWPRSRLFARTEDRPEPAQQARFQALLERRLDGEPVAYLLGRQEFWSLSLKVSPACLIPRPETECLVEQVLGDTRPQASLLDLGTGSGALALALKQERPGWTITASDASAAALALARDNAQTLGLRIDWRHGHWYAPVAGERFDWIVSNPPYVASGDPHLAALRHEPASALCAGADGLQDLREIIAGASAHLRPGGGLVLEHGFAQGPAVRRLLEAAGLAAIASHRDLAGQERLSTARRP